MHRLIKPASGFALFALLAGCAYIPSASKLGLTSSEQPRQVGERRSPMNNAATMAQISQAASAPVPVSEALAREATGTLTPGAPVQGFAQASQDPIAVPSAPVAEQQQAGWWDRNFGSSSAAPQGRRAPTENPGGVQMASPAPEIVPVPVDPQAPYPALSTVPPRELVAAPVPGETTQAMNSLTADRDRVAQDAMAMRKDMADQQVGEPLPPPAADQYVSVPRPIITTSEPVAPREPVIREITPVPPAEAAMPLPPPPPAGAPREIMPPLPPVTASTQDFSDPNGAISTTPIAVSPAPEVASVSPEPAFIAEPPAAPLLHEPEARGQRFLPDSRYAARRASQRLAHSGY